MSLFQGLRQNLKRLGLVLPRRDRQILWAVVLLLSVFLVCFPSPTAWLEQLILDAKNWVYGNQTYKVPSQEFLIAAIDTRTLDESPHSWPWPHSYWAEIIAGVTNNAQPEAVVIDVFFSGKKDEVNDPVEPLAREFLRNGRIGLVAIFNEIISGKAVQMQMFPPEKKLREAAAFWGLTQQKIDRDGRIRTFLLQDQRLKKRHLAWELQNFLKLPLPDENVFFNRDRAEILLALRHPARGFPRISLIELVSGKIDPEICRGKTLIIGATAPVLHDFHETSLGLVSGPDIVASALQTLRHGRMQIYLPNLFSRFLFFLIGIAAWLFLASDLVVNKFRFFLVSLVFFPTILFAASFWPVYHPPVGIALVSFLGVSLISFALFRIVIASEIRQSLHEAEICGRLQKGFFPAGILQHQSGINCLGHCIPYQNAGGDYYDFFTLKNGRIFFLLGDVSGHGISASMLTTAAKTVVSLNRDRDDFSLPDLYQQLNQAIITLTGKKMMMTACAGLIDFEADRVSLISAGHLPAVLRKQEGVEEFAVPGFPLGVAPKYKVVKLQEFPLPQTGFLVMYSDGIIEGVNWKNEQYGFDRFNEKVAGMAVNSGGNTVIEELLRDLTAHCEGRPFEDDVTFLVVDFNRISQGAK